MCQATSRLLSHPCVITVEEMAAARHFIKTQGANFSEEQRYNILQPQLEINPGHAIIKKLNELRSSNPKLALLVTEQLFANAMVSAGNAQLRWADISLFFFFWSEGCRFRS